MVPETVSDSVTKKQSKKSSGISPELYYFTTLLQDQYPIPAPGAGAAGAGSLIFATADSVVRSVLATDVAF